VICKVSSFSSPFRILENMFMPLPTGPTVHEKQTPHRLITPSQPTSSGLEPGRLLLAPVTALMSPLLDRISMAELGRHYFPRWDTEDSAANVT
jgi:hypothetical protein